MGNIFFERYPGVKDYIERAKEDCRKNEFIETVWLRRRYLPKINSKNYGEKFKAERQVLSSICQGSAADIIKKSMIEINAKLRKLNENKEHLEAMMVLQIHDELLFEVKKEALEKIKALVRDAMEDSVKLLVPFGKPSNRHPT